MVIRRRYLPILAVLFLLAAGGVGYSLGRTASARSSAPGADDDGMRAASWPGIVREMKPQMRRSSSRTTNASDRSTQPASDARSATVAQTSIPDLRRRVMELTGNEDPAALASARRAFRKMRATGGELLSVIGSMVESESAAERRSAVAAAALAFPDDGRQLVCLDDDKEDVQRLHEEAKRNHVLISVVGEGLRDEDCEVRSAAYDSLRTIDRDVASVLTSQLLCGSDSELKLQLLADTAGKATDRDMSVSITALDDGDEAVRAAAAENLRKLTGQDFGTKAEACDWWEANHADFLLRASGVTENDNVVQVLEPVPEEPDKPNEDLQESDLSTPTPNR